MLAIIGAFMRGEDKFEVGEGRARYFMTLGHASVITVILGFDISFHKLSKQAIKYHAYTIAHFFIFVCD